MGQRILVMGASGTGKSASLRNFKADEIKLIKIIGKPLPFRGKFTDSLTSDKVNEITKAIRNTDKKIIVIDDCQYTMGNEFFRRALEKGYDKFSEIGQNFFNLLAVADDVPEDVFIYYLCHTETDANGNEKVKTIGKMLDEKLTVEGYFTIVLKTVCADGVYSFQTQNNGHDTVKSPMGMFNGYLIENDLKMVDSVAREYWGYSDEVVEQKVVATEKPARKSRTATEEKPARTSRRTLAESIAAGEPVEEIPVCLPPANEERKKINDGLTDEEREAFKAEMRAKNEAYKKDMEELEAATNTETNAKDVTEMSDVDVVKPTETKKRQRKTAPEEASSEVTAEEPIRRERKARTRG